MGKAEEKFVAVAEKIKERLEYMANSEGSVALIDILIKRVTNEDFSNVVEVIEDFNSIDTILDDAVFSYTEKCKLTKKIIDSNFKVINDANVINLSSKELREIFKSHGYNNVTDISEVIAKIDTGEMTNVSKDLISELKQAILLSGKNDEALRLGGLYEALEKFASNPSRSDDDYKKASLILEKIGVSGVLEEKTKLIEYYLGYYRSIDKKNQQHQNKPSINMNLRVPETKQPTISRSEAKKKLSTYCNLAVDSEFNYENYDEVLSLLNVLELADNVNARYFNYCYQNRIVNESYYNLLLTKIKNNKKYQETINLINWYLENIESKEDKIAAYQEISEILKEIPDIEMLNFDYEYETMKRVRDKHE